MPRFAECSEHYPGPRPHQLRACRPRHQLHIRAGQYGEELVAAA